MIHCVSLSTRPHSTQLILRGATVPKSSLDYYRLGASNLTKNKPNPFTLQMGEGQYSIQGFMFAPSRNPNTHLYLTLRH